MAEAAAKQRLSRVEQTAGLRGGSLGHDPGPIVDATPDRLKAREEELRPIWAGCILRNDRTRSIVPITFRPLDDSIRDCAECLLSIAYIEPRRRPL